MSLPALKFFRFSLGFLILYDLVQHFTDINFLYTDSGILPLEIAMQKAAPWHHSIYFWSGNPTVVTALYLAHIALAFTFMIGRGMPWVTFALWIFQFSLRNRNFIVNDGGDDLSIIFLFISIFLSLKHSANEKELTPFKKDWITLWSLVFIVQLLCMYFFSALKKSDASWNENFTASFLALRIDILSNSFGHTLLRFPFLLKVMTAFTYYLELWGSALFFACILFHTKISVNIRKTLCLLFIFFHLCLAFTMRLWVFPFFCIIAWASLYVSLCTTKENPVAASEFSFRPKNALLLLPLFVLGVILNWNLKEVKYNTLIPEPIRIAGRELSLWQNWGMFAPFPMLNNYHVKILGKTTEGKERELYGEKDLFSNRHRVKLLLNFYEMDGIYLESMLNYFCSADPALTEVKIEMSNSLINRQNFELKESRSILSQQNCIQSK